MAKLPRRSPSLKRAPAFEPGLVRNCAPTPTRSRAPQDLWTRLSSAAVDRARDFADSAAFEDKATKIATDFDGGDRRPVAFTQGIFQALVSDAIGREIEGGVVAEILIELCAKIDLLTAEVAEVKAFGYRGVFKQGETYPAGGFVTHDGSLWHANAATAARPGSGPDWTLAVKRGRDGKGA